MSAAWMPRRRVLLALHRWLGAAAALFLVVLSVTGLALNHTERLRLDHIRLHHPWLLARYGMALDAAEAPVAWPLPGAAHLIHFRGQLIVGDRAIAATDRPVGLVTTPAMVVVAVPDALIYLTPSGELIEKIAATELPFSRIEAVGHTPSGHPVLQTPDGLFAPDADWLDFAPATGPIRIEPPATVALSARETAALEKAWRGEGVPLYRVLLDLHAGRLFGLTGTAMMDLTAVAILLLVISGFAGWLRKSRANGSGNRKAAS